MDFENHPLANPELSPEILWIHVMLDDKNRVAGNYDDRIWPIIHKNPSIPLLALENSKVAIVADWAKRQVLRAEHDALNHSIYNKTNGIYEPIEKAVAVLEEMRPHLWKVHPLLKSLVEIYLDFGPLGSFHQSLKVNVDTFAEEHQTMANEALLEPMLKLHRERRFYSGSNHQRQQQTENYLIPLGHISPWILIRLQHAAWMILDEHRVNGSWKWDFHAPMAVLDSMMAGLRIQHEDIMKGLPARREWYPHLLLEACRKNYIAMLSDQLRPNTLGLEIRYNPMQDFIDQIERMAACSGLTVDEVMTALKEKPK